MFGKGQNDEVEEVEEEEDDEDGSGGWRRNVRRDASVAGVGQRQRWTSTRLLDGELLYAQV